MKSEEIRLPLTLLSWEGPDTRDFLSRLSTVSLKAFNGDLGTWGAFLDATAKIQSDFYIWTLSDEHFILETASPEQLLAWVNRFHFAEAFALRVLGQNPKVTLQKGGLSQAKPSLTSTGFEAGRAHGDAYWETLYEFGPVPQEPMGIESWNAFRITNGIPWAGHEMIEPFNPIDLGFRKVLENKSACYPGQEVVEKIISRGQAAHRLCRIRWREPGLGHPDSSELRVGEAVAGTLTTRGTDASLCVLKRRFAVVGTEVEVENSRAVVDWIA